MAKQGNASKFSRVNFTNFLLIFVLTNQNEATKDSRANRTVQEYVIGDELERLELNLYTNSTTYSFRLSDLPMKFCKDANVNHPEDCRPTISLSLLKMQCNNATDDSYMELISMEANSTEKHICRNYTYLYTDMYEAMHKNLREFKDIRQAFSITPMGKWSAEDTHASILVSIHYVLINRSECPSNKYFDCTNSCKNNTIDNFGNRIGKKSSLQDDDDDEREQPFNPSNSICIPFDWMCDKKPNCGLCGDADEAESVCFWSESAGVKQASLQYALVVVSLVVSFMITPVLVLVMMGRVTVRLCKTLRRTQVPFPSRSSSTLSASTFSDVETPAPLRRERTESILSKDSLELPPSYIDVMTSRPGIHAGAGLANAT